MHRPFAFLVALAVVTSSVHADWTETFPSGTTTNTWQFGLQPTGADASYGYFSGGATLQSGSTFAQGGALVAFNVVTSTFSGTPGVRTRALVNPFGESILSRNVGVMSLFDSSTGDAYALTVDYLAGNLGLARITSGSIAVTASTSIVGFGSTTSYTLELDVSGSNVTGRVYTSGTALVGNVAWPDPFPLAAGFSGVVAQRDVSDATLYGVYGTVSAAVVPEPAVGLIGTVAAAAWLAGRRRRGVRPAAVPSPRQRR